MNAEDLHDYFGEFLAWERSTRDVIDLKKTYIDVVGDIECGLMLSQIVYWHLPSRKGEGKLTIYRDNHWWLAKKRYDWWEETRLTPKQVDRCLKMLRNLGFIYTKVYRFAGDPIVHIRMDIPKFLSKFWEAVYDPPSNPFLPDGEKPISLKVKNEVDEKVITSLPFGQILYTETTAETTTEIPSVVANATPSFSTPAKREPLTFPVLGLTAKLLEEQAAKKNGSKKKRTADKVVTLQVELTPLEDAIARHHLNYSVKDRAKWNKDRWLKIEELKLAYEECEMQPENVKPFVEWYTSDKERFGWDLPGQAKLCGWIARWRATLGNSSSNQAAGDWTPLHQAYADATAAPASDRAKILSLPTARLESTLLQEDEFGNAALIPHRAIVDALKGKVE